MCVSVCMCVRSHAHAHVCVCLHVCACVGMCAHTCVFVHLHTPYGRWLFFSKNEDLKPRYEEVDIEITQPTR